MWENSYELGGMHGVFPRFEENAVNFFRLGRECFGIFLHRGEERRIRISRLWKNAFSSIR